MKRFLAICLVMVMTLSLCACGEDQKLAETLCQGQWESTDHTFVLDTVDRTVVYVTLRFFEDGICEYVCENYTEGQLVSISSHRENWEVKKGQIAIFPDMVDSDTDTIYLEYVDGTLVGSAWYCDSFTYTHVSGGVVDTNLPEAPAGSLGLEYGIQEDGTCTVLGIGSCEDKQIIIPETFEGHTVTAIGAKAFQWKLITGVTIPDTVTTIGEDAFYKCSMLKDVTIGNGVTSIGENAFFECTSLEMITIPNSVTTIGKTVFWKCSSLKEVNIGSGVTSIGKLVFYECPSLSTVHYEGTRSQWRSMDDLLIAINEPCRYTVYCIDGLIHP